MTIGPGKYDDLCTIVREEANAAGAVLIIFGGNKGEGFSVQVWDGLLLQLPTILHNLADELQHNIKEQTQ